MTTRMSSEEENIALVSDQEIYQQRRKKGIKYVRDYRMRELRVESNFFHSFLNSHTIELTFVNCTIKLRRNGIFHFFYVTTNAHTEHRER